jgi:hypothetical protein
MAVHNKAAGDGGGSSVGIWRLVCTGCDVQCSLAG